MDSEWGEDIFPLADSKETPFVSSDNTPRKQKFRAKIATLKKKLRSKTSLLSQAKKENRGVKPTKASGFTPRDLNRLPPFARALVRMQLYHKPRMPFAKDEKKVATTLFYKSPSLYRFLRLNKVVLPSESSVKMWITDFNAKAGFDKILLNKINEKVKTMAPSEKRCILMFDEMDIKQFVDYSRKSDMAAGFEDLGEFGRRPVLAKKSFVLMVRGIYAKWKLPLAYFFSENPIKAENLKLILETALGKLENVSLMPLAVVCDQSTTNQKLYKLLNVSVANPFFYSNYKKYYAIFDPPHLIKTLRNNFLSGNFHFYMNKEASFQVVKDLYKLDSTSSTGRAIPRITEKHLYPNTFQKMNVKLAAQVFSHSVAAAIKAAVATKQLPPSALDTADLVEKIDKLFDALNSQTLYAAKPWHSALSYSNIYAQKALQDGYLLCTTLTKSNTKTGALSRPPCFQGMCQTINAVSLMLIDSIGEGFKFLFTRRLNQDPLENQFSIYRQSGGYNRNPTARTFKAAFMMSATINLIKPPQSNCEEDEDISLKYVEEDDTMQESPASSFSSDTSGGSTLSTNDNEVSIEKSAVVYFGGYLLKKLNDKFKCDLCKEFLQSEIDVDMDQNECLIFFKNYNINEKTFGHLKVPSPILKSFTDISMRYFSKCFKKFCVRSGLSKTIEKCIIKNMKIILPDWFVQNECREHRHFILQLLIRTLIFHECKKMSMSIKNDSKNKTSKETYKLSILKKN